MLGAIVDSAIKNGLITQDRVEQLVKEAEAQTGVTIDLSKKEQILSQEDKKKQDEQRAKDEESKKQANLQKQQQEEERKKNEELNKKLEADRKAKEEANRKAQEEKKKNAQSDYESQLSDADKLRFKNDSKRLEETSPTSFSPTSSTQTSSTPTTRSSNANLGNLTITRNVSGTDVSVALSPIFSEDYLKYLVAVPYDTSVVKITPTVSDTGKATVTMDGESQISGQAKTVTFDAIGTAKAISIVVTAENGTKKTYSVTVFRDSESAFPGSVSITSSDKYYATFPQNERLTLWTSYLPEAINSASLNIYSSDMSSKVIFEGTEYSNGTPIPLTSLPVGQSEFQFQVKATSGSIKGPFTVNIVRIPAGHGIVYSVSSMKVNGTDAAYDAASYSYSATVPATATEAVIDVQAARDWIYSASISIYKDDYTGIIGKSDGTHVTLNETGDTIVNVRVTSFDRSHTQLYHLILHREVVGSSSNATLQSLVVQNDNGGETWHDVVFGFDPNEENYEPALTAAEKAGHFRISAAAIATGATLEVRKDGGPPLSPIGGYYVIGSATNSIVSIKVTAPNGDTRKIYNILLNKIIPGLSDFAMQVNTESSFENYDFAFNPLKMEYDVPLAFL